MSVPVQTTWLASPSKSSREFLYMYIYIYIYVYIYLYFKGVRSQARLPGNSNALENAEFPPLFGDAFLKVM